LDREAPGTCVSPQYLAAELLRAEGVTDIQYVEKSSGATEPLAIGKVDFDTNYASNFVRAIDAAEPVR
jgi:NitT/TauT family transport system substrate-binding protein